MRVGRRAGNRLGEVEALALLRLAEVGRVEQLLQADDLRAACARRRESSRSARAQRCSCVGVGVILNDSDGERLEIAIGHTIIMRHDGPNRSDPNYRSNATRTA